MHVVFLYAFFAVIATASNIAAQVLVVRIPNLAYAVPLSIAAGTAVGLLVKYALDKRWVFEWKPKNAGHNAKTFFLYALTGVFTTAIFWLCEYLFAEKFHSEAMRYLGGTIGLAIGYVTKYQMDRAFVFFDVRSKRSGDKVFRVLTVALILFTGLKLIGITATSPLIAYPDNWDFARVESCMGLWEDYGNPAIEAHLSGPVNNLVLTRKTNSSMCAASIDTLFPYIVSLLFHKGDRIDLRYIGALRVAVTLFFVAALIVVSRGDFARFVIAVLFSLVFGEFAYIAYANTMYNEYSILLGVFVGVSSMWLAWTNFASNIKWLTCIFAASLILVGMAKPQYSPLAPVMGLVGAAIFWRRGYGYRSVLSLATLGIASMVMYSLINPSDDGFGRRLRLVNITDTVFTEVLPHASNVSAAIDALGLPQSCGVMIGKSFYSPGVDAHHPCPEVIDVSRARLLPLFIRQPSILTRSLNDGVVRIRPFPGAKYGFFEDSIYAQSRRVKFTEATSVGTYLNRLPDGGYRALMRISMLLVLPLALWCSVSIIRRRMSWHGMELLLVAGGTLVLYSIASSVFGDGTTEVFKHAFLWVFGVGLEVVSLAGLLLFSVGMYKPEMSEGLMRRTAQSARDRISDRAVACDQRAS
ncbi:MAG: GtrA family protein [Paraburkholderia tropica]|nr:GtrA family protein [Paraburkholderia tropica]